LKKYCTSEVINRREAEHKAFEAHGIFFDNKVTISTLKHFLYFAMFKAFNGMAFAAFS
jgi:hypothetical protein